MSIETDSKIRQAFERLMLGRPEITDGALTVSNLCTEAGVSRASYYRSPQAAIIKEVLDTPQIQRPEIEDLRARVKQLTKTERQLRAEHAGEVRDLRDTIKTYANQIQALALLAGQLADDNERLRNSIPHTGGSITHLDTDRHQVSDSRTDADRVPSRQRQR
jgi:hypothetical protein